MLSDNSLNKINNSYFKYSLPIVKSKGVVGGLLAKSCLKDKISYLNIPVYERAINTAEYQDFTISNEIHKLALPVTFTPYASAKPCSARCWFCSENLEAGDVSQRAASLRPGVNYQQLLKNTLNELKNIPMGLSLSGLEMTDDVEWLLASLDTLGEWGRIGGLWQEKAGYTNAAGLVDTSKRKAVIDSLSKLGFDRIELSRHHFDSDINQIIMRFRKSELIQEAKIFESVLESLNSRLPISLVCIIQRGGISSLEQIDKYLKWARNLGVRKVIFRELCDVPVSYKNNRTLREICLARQGIEQIVQSWLDKESAKINHFVNGYYFWNANFSHQNTEVIFERSDYTLMNENHSSDIVHKLVFFANGNLCAGWEPDKEILYSSGAS